MPITNLNDLQYVASRMLKEAMTNERSRRWPKVVQNYRRLLRMLDKTNLPPDFNAPPWMPKLYYELYYHLGFSLQQVGDHQKAVLQYTRALDAIALPKNGCSAGCNANSCLMTPVHARRALAYAKSGEFSKALKDAERAVVLDNKNPDVYCIRSLARSTMGNEKLALEDSITALKYNASHPCALLLSGNFKWKSNIPEWKRDLEQTNINHQKACSINPDCHNFLTIRNLNHPDIVTFFDRFLYSLGVPHTLSEICLKNAEATTSSCMPHDRTTDKGTSSFSSPLKFLQPNIVQETNPFKCGTIKNGVKDDAKTAAMAVQRRKEYGAAIRQKTSQPKTAEQFIASLERDYKMKALLKERRAFSATSAFRERSSPVPEMNTKRPVSADDVPSRVKFESTTKTRIDIKDVYKNVNNTVNDFFTVPLSNWNQKTLKMPDSKVFVPVPKPDNKVNTNVKIFTPVNLKEAPRMYYRPWSGDKLPVATRKERPPAVIPFKC